MVGVEDHFNGVVEPCQVLIDGIVDHFPDAVMQGGAVVGVSEVHSGSFSNRFKSLENLDASGVVIFTHFSTSKRVKIGRLRAILVMQERRFPPSKYTARHGV